MLLLADLAPVLLGGLLAWTGAAKLFGRTTQQQAADTALMRILHDSKWVVRTFRALGAVELVVALGLVALPVSVAPSVAACALGVGFLAYLGWAKVNAPDSSCGCSARKELPITWRAFVRAGLVVVGGGLAAFATTPWWAAAVAAPLASALVVVLAVALVGTMSTDLDHLWLLPLRRLRLRLLGHPLSSTAVASGPVPYDASLELLELSQAWAASAPVVRSSLLEHWDADGWRILRFAGAWEGPSGTRPVSVLFAMDANASIDTTTNPLIRVTVVDDQTNELLPDAIDTTSRPQLPVTPA